MCLNCHVIANFCSGETTIIFDDKIDFKVAVFGGQCAKDQIQHTASVMKKHVFKFDGINIEL